MCECECGRFSAQEGAPLNDDVLLEMSEEERVFWEDFFAEADQVIVKRKVEGKSRPFAPTVSLKEKYEKAITKYDGGKYCAVKQRERIFAF